MNEYTREIQYIPFSAQNQEQIVDILGLPKLYEQLPRLFEIHNFESHEILDKANTLKSLLDEYAPMLV